MDKRVIFAVAGSGKTTYIIENLSREKRSLVVTYTKSNYATLLEKITKKFGGELPDNIVIMTYFAFLYRFCYKPFLADKYKAKGVLYERNPNQYLKQENLKYYLNANRYFYSNRLSLFLEKCNVISEIMYRIEKYFDEFAIDEIQDIAGRDFHFLEKLMLANINMLFVGDYYQHTFNTSRDGNVNNNLFSNKAAYETRFTDKEFIVDSDTLSNSYRCSKNVCDFISANLQIQISSHRPDYENATVEHIIDTDRITAILNDEQIIKLHYANASKFGIGHKNWGDSKGDDRHNDICILLNKTTTERFSKNQLQELAPATKNKLYVALTRTRGNVYLINDL